MISKGKKKINLIIAIIALLVISILAFFVTNTQINFETDNLEVLRSKAYTQITDKDAKVDNCDYVQFSAFFTRDLDNDGNAEKLLGTCRKVNATDELYLDINVLTNGTLKDGIITIESTNFDYKMNMVKDSVLKENYISNNVEEIKLNDIKAGTQKLIIGSVVNNLENNINNYSNTSVIKLKGTHVADDGVTKTPIEKEFVITVDWHGTTKAKIQNSDLEFYYNDLSSNTLKLKIKTDELDQNLILKENIVNVEIPKLEGYAPIDVKCTNSNVKYEYDKENQKLVITRTSKIDEKGEVITKLSPSNTYDLEITYPQEAYKNVSSFTTVTLKLETYYTGYNNLNKEFTNPYKSNIASGVVNLMFSEKPEGEIYNFYVNFEDKEFVSGSESKYAISKQPLLNAYNKENSENIEYLVSWKATRGPAGEVTSIVMNEIKANDYGDAWDQKIIDEYVTNTGIYFKNADKMLEEDGYINIYNYDTNELVKTFTKKEWNTYTKENPFKYEKSIKHIKIETSKAKKNSDIIAYHIKELDVEKVKSNFKIEEIEAINLMHTYLEGICNIEDGRVGELELSDSVYYDSEKSNVNLDISKRELSTQETYNNQELTIEVEKTQITDADWKNGQFLLEFPKEIVNLNIKSINISTSSVNLVAYDLYNENGQYFLKIFTENEEPTTYNIKINCSLTPDPRIATINKDIKLYAYNEICDKYYYETEDIYDVDEDDNKTELKGYRTKNINLLSPTSLITLETITDYNDAKDVTVGPNVAELEIGQEQATVNVILTNNYPNPISGIKVLGKIPFEGNTHILNPNNLNSEFTVIMSKDGLKLPKELENKVNVYYSVVENPTKEINDSSNRWTIKEKVEDFSKIRTYLIDLKETQLEKGAQYTFSYDVKMPKDKDYNLVSYSTHAAYYELNTEGGNLKLSTEPNKVGLSFVRKYDFSLTKNKEKMDLLVPNATYKLVELGVNNEELSSRTGRTNSNGTLKIKDIYVGKKYLLKEIYSPLNYKLSDAEIIFTVVEKEDKNLEIQVISEEKFNETPILEKSSDGKDILSVKVSDKPNYELTITKLSSGKPIKDISFRIPELKRIFTTDDTGKIVLNELEQNKEYTLEEINADGYYLLEPIKFKLIEQNDGTFELENSNNVFKNIKIINPEDKALITVSLDITNEKIPTYNLELLKIEQNENLEDAKKLQGAKFEFKGKDSNIQKTFSTDENGIINISDLFVYVEGKDITGEYTLQEIEAPQGYTNNAEEINFKVIKNTEGNLEIQIQNLNELKSIKSATIDGNTVKFVVENTPTFKLVKTDSDTGKKLANVGFVIYEIDNNGNTIDFAKNGKNEYLGQKQDDIYVITTDQNGEVTLPLKNGKYKAIEVNSLEGYIVNDSAYEFVVGGEQIPTDDYSEYTDLVINYDTELALEVDSIEDLVILSKNVNSGSEYSGKLITLTKDLDFNEDSSYEDPTSKTFGDLNQNGIEEELKIELTSRDGCGFTPIGGKSFNDFWGTFDGQGHEIRNLYINKNKGDFSYCGLFGSVYGAKIKDLGITGDIFCGGMSGAFIGYLDGKCRIENCYNKANITVVTTSAPYVGGLIGDMYDSDGSIIANCYNKGNINANDGYCGGIASGPRSRDLVINCYNEGNILGSKDINYVGGIAGYSSGQIINCYNVGIITAPEAYCVGGIFGDGKSAKKSYNMGNIHGDSNVGGISGRSENIELCYNLGRVIGGDTYTGGITGNGKTITQCYNSGKIIGSSDCNGIGYAYTVENCYNDGEINASAYASGISEYAEIKNCYNSGKIIGSKTGGISANYYDKVTNSYYIEDDYTVLRGTSIAEEYSKTKEFYDKLNIDNVWIYYGTTHPKLGIGKTILEIDGSTLNIENSRKSYIVTTEVEEIDGIKGGSISGDGELKYEEILYNDSNELEIKMVPDPKFGISQITINDRKIEFITNADGSYTIPAGYFKNVKEDYHIVVSYAILQETMTINKVDENDENLKLEGAKFKIEQLSDYREKIVQGELIENPENSYEADKTKENINSVIGELTKTEEEYYFEKVDDKIVSNNQGVKSDAESYIPIDLTNKEGDYIVEVNVSLSGNKYNDGKICITDELKSYFYTQDVLVELSGTLDNESYVSKKLEGGKIYYLYLLYYNDYPGTDLDQFTINSIDVYPAKTVTHTFEEKDNKYVSNNQGKNSTIAVAYLPIDLTNNYGKYNIKVNAEISADSTDYGYINLVDDIKSTSSRSIGTLNGEKEATNYEIKVTGGKLYYIKLQYKKSVTYNSGDDRFIINSIDISPILSTLEGTTDSKGALKVRAPHGKYKITEIEAPSGYVIDAEPKELEILANNENSITITNSKTLKELKITTDINEINGEKGGTITGEDEQPYKTVKVNNQDDIEIIINPNDGYKIIKITINEEEISFKPDSDGNFKIPESEFKNIKENKHVVVTFGPENQILTINKVDANDNSKKLADAKFKIQQEDSRKLSDNVFEEMVPNGEKILDNEKPINGVLGELVANDHYYFVEENNQIVSKNKTNSTIARSYIPLDLTGLTGTYIVKINAEISASRSSYGSVSITETTDAPSRYSSNNRVFYIQGIVEATDYESIVLEGGKTYYLHLMYDRYASSDDDVGEDQLKINSIEVYGTTILDYMKIVDEKYQSTTQNKNNSVADSYIPINLTDYQGKYNLNINAEISSELYGDFGYCVITNSKDIPSREVRKSGFVYISGEENAKDYTTVLNGMNQYYLHIGYEKDSENTKGKDTFTINSISLSLNSSDLYTEIVTTNENGEAQISIPEGKYVITEITPPEGYILNSEPIMHEMIIGENNSITIKNTKKSKVIVHHYVEETGEEYGKEPQIVSENEILEDGINEEYITAPKLDVEEYSLIKDKKGEYIIPENASGLYEENVQHVYYYYTKNSLNLTVHHYLEGTESSLADDEFSYHPKNYHYITKPSEEVLKKYELVSVVGDKEKDLTQNEVVTYFYKPIEFKITTRVEVPEGVTENTGSISGENEKPYEIVNCGESSKKDIIATPNKGYKVSTITINGENITFTEKDGKVQIDKFENMTEDKEVVVTFVPTEGKVITHHYIQGTEEKLYEDIVDIDKVGVTVQTFPVYIENYKLVDSKGNKDDNGNVIIEKEITEGVEEIVYYYQKAFIITTDVIEHSEKYKDGTTQDNIKAGFITNEDVVIHEEVMKYESNQEIIELIPDEGYEVYQLKANGKNIDVKELKVENSETVIIPKEFFNKVEEDIHVEVEFRKKAKVIVKFLEKDTEKELAKEVEIIGYEGEKYNTIAEIIPEYVFAKDKITNENKEIVKPNGIMYSDDTTVIYWYEKSEANVIERHIELNAKGEEIEIEYTEYEKNPNEDLIISRKELEDYISVEAPNETKEEIKNNYLNVTIAERLEDEITVTTDENAIKEVWYYYLKQYQITTDVALHKEIINEEELEVAGGTISKEYEIDENGKEVELVYEVVDSRADSSKEIKMLPDDGYRIKEVTINSEELDIKSMLAEDGSLLLPKAYFKDVQMDYHIVVEYERIPAKVIVEYIDKDTKENIKENKVIDGFVNDEYNEERPQIDNYIPAEPEPTNPKGKMTEETITITYYYKKQYKITTDVKEHEETDNDGNKVTVKGGKITGEDETPLETVSRGEASTKIIKAEPDSGYRIIKLSINGILYDFRTMLDDKGILTIPVFENMQEDKHIVVEFERIPAQIIVKHIDEETGEELTNQEIIKGFVNKDYSTTSKEFAGYEVNKNKLPKNANGKMTEDEIVVIYYYNKIETPKEEDNQDLPEIKPEVKPNDNQNIPEQPDNNQEIQQKPQIKPNTPTHIENVKTGDNILGYAILLAVSIVGIILIIICKNKKK